METENPQAQLQGFIHTFAANPASSSGTASSKAAPGSAEHRPRRRNASGKRFRCDHEGCDKNYSRAEHLQRHQLNHDPKEIFQCGYPGCSLSFVRKDLRDRHSRRHNQQSPQDSSVTTNGDAILSNGFADDDVTRVESRNSTASSSFVNSTASSEKHPDLNQPPDSPGDDDVNNEAEESTSSDDDDVAQSIQLPSIFDPAKQANGAQEAASKKRSFMDEHDQTRFHNMRNHFSRQSDPSPISEEQMGVVTVPNNYTFQQNPSDQFPSPQLQRHSSATEVQMAHGDQPNLAAMQSTSFGGLEPFGRARSFSTAQLPSGNSRQEIVRFDSFDINQHNMIQQNPSSTMYPAASTQFAQHNADMAFQTAGLDEFGISPSAGTDEFTSWLFDSAGAYHGNNNGDATFSTTYQPNVFGQVYSNYFTTPPVDDHFANPLPQNFSSKPLSDTISPVEKPLLSSWKRQILLDIMQQRFTGSGNSNSVDRGYKQQIFETNVDDDEHPMSLTSLHHYIDSYWKNFHDQFPILHKPTFRPDYVHEYLLLAVIVVGASLLHVAERERPAQAKAAAQLANFIAWNLRWQVFTDADSCPPARLWVLQTLAILEFYEKINATRALHERAHVHFAATLTLMRRGSALVGESIPAASRAIHGGDRGSGWDVASGDPKASSEKWWSHWIAQEATRRAAFGAFFLDATHAVMFGHAATMVIHEIQLPLPCDDTLWSAPTSSEVARVELSLYTNGIKPMTFLGGLKRTLSCRKSRTNSFGRIMLMCGLLSVTWHMKQRDLYGESLDKQNMGVPEGWKGQIIKALEWWKKDYDESLAHMRKSGIDLHKTGFTHEREQTSESLGSVLYHLGHIALQVDMPDLCILAGAKTLLGRVITPADRERVHNKLKIWAQSADARHAVHYSLRFITMILLPDVWAKRTFDFPRPSPGESQHGRNDNGRSIYTYCAANDYLLLRPWVLYFSTLVVWAYGFVLDGPCQPFPESLKYPVSRDKVQQGIRAADQPIQISETLREREQDARSYVAAMCRFENPAALSSITSGRNKVIGLISVVSKVLEGSRWELLCEARDRLQGAAELLRSSAVLAS